MWVLIAGIFLIALLFAFVAEAHDWYDPACCSGLDCKPVHDNDVIETPQGVLVKGWGILSRSDPRIRTSRDDASHICEVQSGLPYARKLYCVYMKPNGM